MGAQIASDLAARFPELVIAMILEDPGWFISRAGAPQVPFRAIEESPLGKWIISLKDKSLEQIMAECRQEHPTWTEAYVRPWCQGKKELDQNFLVVDHSRSSWQELIPKIQCPMLVITAEPSLGGIVTPEAANLAKELNPNIRIVNFPGVGHHVRFAIHKYSMIRLWAVSSPSVHSSGVRPSFRRATSSCTNPSRLCGIVRRATSTPAWFMNTTSCLSSLQSIPM
jgi:hypothetical protein